MMKNICLSLAASTALIAGVTQAASPEYLIRIEGVPGTSTLEGFTDYFAVGSWSLGYSRGVCHGLSFTKTLDEASAYLTEAALLGTFYPSAIVVGLKTGEDDPFINLKLTLTNSVVTSFQNSASAGSGLPIESVVLQPSSVKLEIFEPSIGGDPTLVATTSVTCQKPK